MEMDIDVPLTMSSDKASDDLARLFARIQGANKLLPELVNLLESNPSPEALTAAAGALKAISISSTRHSQNIHFVFQHVLDAILDQCQLDEVVLFGQLSIYFRVRVKNYLVRRWHATLSNWIQKPVLFRDCMRHTKSVISGSTALAFADGSDWDSQDLDVYTARGRGRDMVLSHLIHIEGYKVEMVTGDDEESPEPQVTPVYKNSQIKSVTKLSKQVYSKALKQDVTRRIDVIESAVQNSISPILRFHTSFVINWITSDSINVAYPKLTFAHIGLVNDRIKLDRPKDQIWREKYMERGFRMILDTYELDPMSCGSACPALWRSTDDVGCMSVQFGDGDEGVFDGMQWSLSKAVDDWSRHRKCMNVRCPRYRQELSKRSHSTP
ncbi:hypothetical protein M407DRAFT_25843 [Tulasnella calospora MUT 4182]|uniref:Uncharacterized protein n=1 Tax=Tulasnella calospora MUT 4182 TaxID=1051891 RepID=A0A0C3QGT1_9AGAM|nr:hypothetical protein M407DRAFT_25843 [Tulasnella calospora MUT 4182]